MYELLKNTRNILTHTTSTDNNLLLITLSRLPRKIDTVVSFKILGKMTVISNIIK